MTRKTEQVIKLAATWTPNETAAGYMRGEVFGLNSPLRIRGGRLTVNAAVATDGGAREAAE